MALTIFVNFLFFFCFRLKFFTKLSVALAFAFGFVQVGLKFVTINQFRAMQNGNAAQYSNADVWCFVAVGVTSFLCLNILYGTQFKG
jgi:hypothetical protein